jgi:hypothetical protein
MYVSIADVAATVVLGCETTMPSESSGFEE